MQLSLVLLSLMIVSGEVQAPKALEITADERQAFDAARAAASNDPAQLVKLAMWAESKGLKGDRDALLNQATALDPKADLPRGLLGQVLHNGSFKSAAEIGQEVDDETSRAAKTAEYNERRDQLNRAEEAERALVHQLEQQGKAVEARMVQGRIDHRLAPAHLKLGLWCETNGLKPESQAHYTSAVMLDPALEAGWKHLGYVKHNGRWMTHERIAAEAKEQATQQAADRQWGPLLQRWKLWLGQESKREDAEKALADLTDPRSVPSIVKTFVTPKLKDQIQAVRLLGAIDSSAASRELAALAVKSEFEPVRREAIETLRGRDPHDYAESLVKMIHTPWTYRFVPVQGPGAGGKLEVDSPRFHLTRTYDAPPVVDLSGTFFGYVGLDPNGLPIVISGRELRQYDKDSAAQKQKALAVAEERTAEAIALAQLKAESSRQQMIADINAIEINNAYSSMTYAAVAPVLQQAAGAPTNLGNDEDAWNSWYYDKLGYTYTPSPQVTIQQQFSQLPPPRIMSCFAAGTPVRTLKGTRPIESLSTGDQVLSQDPRTGALSFQPILVVHRNPPAQTLEVALDNGDILVASRFHRFWIAGQGWVMAKDLKAGDAVRTLGSLSRIERLTPGPFVPVFNLDVAGGRTFFVGDHDALVHDNSLPAKLAACFDAKAELKALTSAKP